MKKERILLVILFLSFLIPSLQKVENDGNNTDFADSPNSSSGELEKLWEKNIEKDGKAICVQGEFICSLSQSGNDTIIAKRLSSNGDLVWEKTIPHNNTTYLSQSSIWQLNNDGYIYTIWEHSDLHYSLLSRWTSEGNLLWNSTLNNVSNPSIWGENEYIYILGEALMENTDRVVYLSKALSSNGSILWEVTPDIWNHFNAAGIWGNNENIFVFGDNQRKETVLITFFKNGSSLRDECIQSTYDCYAKGIWGNERELFTTTSFYDNGWKNFVISMWDFEGHILLDSFSEENMYANSVWCDEESFYSFGAHINSSSFSLAQWDINNGNIIHEEKYEGISPISASCVRGENKKLYTIGGNSIIGWTTGDVVVDIIDATSPVITQEIYDTSINWTITDESFTRYVVYKDGLEELSGFCSSEAIVSVSLEGLEKGTYNYTLEATDLFGNMASSSAIIEIKAPPINFGDKLFSLWELLSILLSFIFIVSIGVILMKIIKNKKIIKKEIITV